MLLHYHDIHMYARSHQLPKLLNNINKHDESNDKIMKLTQMMMQFSELMSHYQQRNAVLVFLLVNQLQHL